MWMLNLSKALSPDAGEPGVAAPQRTTRSATSRAVHRAGAGRPLKPILVAAWVLWAGFCPSLSTTPVWAGDTTPAQAVPAFDATPTAPETPAAAQSVPAGSTQLTPYERLNQIDSRTPIPMHAYMALHHKEEMRDHLKVMQEVVEALSRKDYTAVEKSAQRLASGGEMGCAMMSGGVKGYETLAEHLHAQAQTVVDAARRKDQIRVLTALNGTLETCVACHSAYKQSLVSGGPGGGMSHP